MDANRIVANGRANLLNDAGTQKKLDDAIREIRSRYAQEMKAEGLIARIRLWLRMRKEIRAAVERVAPSNGCYLNK
jgi:head-tail adaptor